MQHRLPFFHELNRIRLRLDRRSTARGVVRNGPAKGTERTVALSFDDGPSPANTGPVLELLARHDARATFFMVGEQVLEHPALARAVLAAGHEIANHSHTHPDPSLVGAPEWMDEFARAAAAIESVVGVRPRLVRPPFGKRAEELAAGLAVDSTVVLWSVDSGDTAGFAASRIAHEVVDHVRPGDIVLMHDGGAARPATIEAAAAILEALRRRGYRFVSVSDVLRANGD